MDTNNWNIRTELLLGKEAMKKLSTASVLVAGVGGVGAYAAEYLCRAGVGKITIVDSDIIEETNLNRQLIALRSNFAKSKVELMAQRLRDINSDAQIIPIMAYLKDEKTPEILTANHFDLVIDAIDTLSPKVHLILKCLELKIKIISSMGSGGKLDPSLVKVSDISKTFNCMLARAVRKKLKKYKVYKGFQAVFSPEDVKGVVIELEDDPDIITNKKSVVGTISYMPSVFACHAAAAAISELLKEE
ncbi:MAG TPA: tRNA threonylcarbamoyladenosine dehydratase [Lentisphaeria bacterium]|nr:MAG: tRNA threonylcarbamoyladenosine dehydratase [Lentisphaerae bacterium GWF2_38_69]HBM15489.1 tRNA threonylcarbamoyladenosine dehydratase [Lentisphaeria bacterium]